jgi:hypothetical protein
VTGWKRVDALLTSGSQVRVLLGSKLFQKRVVQFSATAALAPMWLMNTASRLLIISSDKAFSPPLHDNLF